MRTWFLRHPNVAVVLLAVWFAFQVLSASKATMDGHPWIAVGAGAGGLAALFYLSAWWERT